MHHVIHYRYIKDSDQNGPFEVKADASIKQARGQQKQLFNSHLDMMQRHGLLGDNFFIDREHFVVRSYTDDGEVLFAHYFYIESDNADNSDPIVGQPQDTD